MAEPGSEMLASLERGSGPFQQRGQHRPRHGGISWLTWLRDQGGVWRVERRGTGGHPRVCWPGPLPTFTGRHHGHHLGADEMQNLGPHTAFLSPSLHVTRPPPCTFLLPSPTADSKAHWGLRSTGDRPRGECHNHTQVGERRLTHFAGRREKADTLTRKVTPGSYKTLEPSITLDPLTRLRVKATHGQLTGNTSTVACEPQTASPPYPLKGQKPPRPTCSPNVRV